MLKDFKKLILITGTALICANGEASSTIASKIRVDEGAIIEVTRDMQLGPLCQISNSGIIMEDTEDHTYLILHPTGADDEAVINNFADFVDGDSGKISPSGPYYRASSPFTQIRTSTVPFIDEHLISQGTQSTGGWGDGYNIFIGDDMARTNGINAIVPLAEDYNNNG